MAPFSLSPRFQADYKIHCLRTQGYSKHIADESLKMQHCERMLQAGANVLLLRNFTDLQKPYFDVWEEILPTQIFARVVFSENVLTFRMSSRCITSWSRS